MTQTGWLKKYWFILVGIAIIFILSIIPILAQSVYDKAVAYYGSLFFIVLLGASVALLIHIPTRIGDKAENRDFNVVKFMLRTALTFGIGAVIIGILIIVFLTVFK